MKKKQKTLKPLLAFFFTFCLLFVTSCSSNPNSISSTSSLSTSVLQQSTAPSLSQTTSMKSVTTSVSTSSKKPTYIKIKGGSFFDTHAWATIKVYEFDSNNQFSSEIDSLSCLDKEGNLLFSFPYDLSQQNFCTAFVNGKAWIIIDDIWSIIDTRGNILLQLSPEEKMVASGDGYLCTHCHKEDFSNNYELYTVYDSDGNALTSIRYEQEKNAVDYRGDGVFSFGYHTNLTTDDIYDFYSAHNNKFFSLDCQLRLGVGDQQWNNFNNGYAVAYADLDTRTTYDCYWMLIDEEGNMTKLDLPTIPTSWEIDQEVKVSEGKVIFVVHPIGSRQVSLVFYYDIEKDSYYNLIPNEYLQYIYTYTSFYSNGEDNSDLSRRILEFKDGVVAVNMKCADDKLYVTMFDENGKILLEPVKCIYPCEITCGRLVVRTEDGCSVYSTDGSLVFETECAISDFCNDIAHITDGYLYQNGENDGYIDINGNYLFKMQDVVVE